MEKIKILIFADGATIHTEKWINGLCLNQNFELYFLTMNPAPIYAGILNNRRLCEIKQISPKRINVGGNNYSYILNFFKIRRYIRALNPDVVTALYLSSYGFFGALLKKYYKLVLCAMGSDVMVFPQKKLANKLTTLFTIKRSDLLMSVSKTLTKEIFTLSPSFSKENLITQQYGLDESILKSESSDKLYDFISNRNWVPNSNIDTILEIFRRIPGPFKLVLTGHRGSLESEILKLIEKDPRVLDFGFVSHLESVNLTSKSKYYISLTNSDGTSLSLLEAMAVGAIPIVSNISPNREWIQDGINGFLIDQKNVDKCVDKVMEVLSLSEEKINEIKISNKSLLIESCSFNKNMSYLNERILGLLAQS